MENYRIDKLDENFKQSFIIENGIKYFDVKYEPSYIFGLPWFKSGEDFYRIPYEKHIMLSSDGVKQFSQHTSGVRLRFRTNSPTITLKVKLLLGNDKSYMPRTGLSGFDFYIGCAFNRKHVKTIMPTASGIDEYMGEATISGDGMEEWLIHFPLYNGVDNLLLGIKDGCIIQPARPYTIEKPIAFYGSSITQGGYASRPGNSYVNIISRWLDADIINLGFSGNAKGEIEIAELINELELSALVIDYDHNAPTSTHLSNTHEPFFKCIRKSKPTLPVIFISRPDFDKNADDSRVRRDIIYKTYINSVNSGDLKTYFIDGEILFGSKDRDSCTVDGCHPNDLGFMRMAEVISPVLKKALDLLS